MCLCSFLGVFTSMKRILKIFLIVVVLLCVPTYVSIDYYGNTSGYRDEEEQTRASVWVHTSPKFDYYILGTSYKEYTDGSVWFMFGSEKEDVFKRLHINSITITYEEQNYIVVPLEQDIEFKDRLFSEFSVKNVHSEFILPFDKKTLRKPDLRFGLHISGYVEDNEGRQLPFVYEREIIKQQKIFYTTLFKHFYYQLIDGW